MKKLLYFLLLIPLLYQTQNREKIQNFSQDQNPSLPTPVLLEGNSIAKDTGSLGVLVAFGTYACRYMGVPYFQRAVPGSYLSHILNRIDTEITRNGINSVILEGGINNILNGITADSCIKTYRSILTICRNRGVQTFAIGMIPNSILTVAKQQKKDSVNSWLLNNISNYNGYFFNVAPLLGKQCDSFSASNFDLLADWAIGDGTHPDTAGQKAIARGVINGIRLHYTLALDTATIWYLKTTKIDSIFKQQFPLNINDTARAYLQCDSLTFVWKKGVNGTWSSSATLIKINDTVFAPYSWNPDTSSFVNGDTLYYKVTAVSMIANRTNTFSVLIRTPHLSQANYDFNYKDLSSSPVGLWPSETDTTKLRQSVISLEPTLINSGVLFDTNSILSANTGSVNHSMTIELFMKITDTNSASAQRIMSLTQLTGIDMRIGFQIQKNSASSAFKLGFSYYNGSVYTNTTYGTNFANNFNQWAVYIITMDSVNKQNLYINAIHGVNAGAGYSSYSSFANKFGLGNTETQGGMKNITIKRFRIFNRVISADEILNDTWYLIDSLGNLFDIKPINDKIPENFSLSQNYPNPFNPFTNIKYQISKRSFVRLIIYDILGQEVAILINENQTPGIYNVDWDANNYSSGVYFYKITAGDFISVKKMILLK